MTVSRATRIERLAAVCAVTALIAAWVAGAVLSGRDETPLLRDALPAADRFESRGPRMFAAYRAGEALGYVATGEADGYGGPIRVAVAVNLTGTVIGTSVIGHTETPSFFSRVASRGFLQRFAGKSYTERFEVGADLDGITGATVTSRALAEAVRSSARLVAGSALGLPVADPPPPVVRFGGPEIAVLLLYAAGFVGHRRRFRYRAVLRWGTLVTGLFVLGFWYNVPLTLSKISSMLMGYWPAWQGNLYWYFLIGGVLVIATVDGKNGYCDWFCPFGAAQECMGAIGGARHAVARRHRATLAWVQRGLAWTALMLAFLFRNPGMSSYEVFGTLFSFTGSAVLFSVLALVLLLALFVKRPWCHFLCPLHPVYEVIHLLRDWVLSPWTRRPRPGSVPST